MSEKERRKRAHTDDELCNYSGRILHHLPAIMSFTLQNNLKKQTSHEHMHPKALLDLRWLHLTPHSLMLSYLSKSWHWSPGLQGGKQSSVETSFWILHQHSISTSSSSDSLVSASLGIFFLYFGKQCRNALWYLRPRPYWRGLEYNLMLHGSRWQVCCICGRHGCQGGTLKTSHYYRYKRSHSTSYSEDEKTASYFTTSPMQHRLGLFKNIVFSGLD